VVTMLNLLSLNCSAAQGEMLATITAEIAPIIFCEGRSMLQ